MGNINLKVTEREYAVAQDMQIITTAQLELQDKGSAIKGLDVWNSWELNALGPALYYWSYSVTPFICVYIFYKGEILGIHSLDAS